MKTSLYITGEELIFTIDDIKEFNYKISQSKFTRSFKIPAGPDNAHLRLDKEIISKLL